MKRFQSLTAALMMLMATLALTACRANLGNFFDLY